jgi:hypothetical protein
MWGSAGTLPRRCRHGAIPTDPARQETPGTFGTQNVPLGLRTATQFTSDDAPRKPRRVSSAPATPHVAMLRTSNIGADSRCIGRVATPSAEQHTDRSATEPSSAGPRIVRAETRSLRSPALLGGLDASAETTRRVTAARWTRPITHMTSEPVMLPPPPRQEQRTRHWEMC